MNEIDYINATDLAKVRIANTALRDCLPQGEDEKKNQKLILLALRDWMASLEKKVEGLDHNELLEEQAKRARDVVHHWCEWWNGPGRKDYKGWVVPPLTRTDAFLKGEPEPHDPEAE